MVALAGVVTSFLLILGTRLVLEISIAIIDISENIRKSRSSVSK
jgi:hypothetical protein